MNVDVVVDMRETRAELPSLFQEHDDVGNVQIDTLDVGDVIVNGEIVFERKDSGDLVSSIQDQRLENQIEKMYDVFGPEKSYLIVESDYDEFEYLPYSQFSSASVYGFVGSISARWQMVPLFTSDREHLVDMVTKISRKHFENTSRVVREPNKSPSTKSSTFFERMVLQLSGVGKSKLEPLKDEFGDMKSLAAATHDELVAIDGIGDSTAEKIRNQIEGND